MNRLRFAATAAAGLLASVALTSVAHATVIDRTLVAGGTPVAVMYDVVHPSIELPEPRLLRELRRGRMVLDVLIELGVPITFARTRVEPRLLSGRERSGKQLQIRGATACLELEELIYKPPLVMEAAVVARPDATWGETPCAFVTLRPGASLDHDDRNLMEPGALGGAPASLASDNLEGVGDARDRANQHRLNDATLSDRGGEFVELVLIEAHAGIARVRSQEFDGGLALATRPLGAWRFVARIAQ